MNPALLELIAISVKGTLRRTFRGARTVKGAFLILFGMGVLLMMVGPSLIASASMREIPGMARLGGWLEPYLPILLLCSCLLVLMGPGGDVAISFTPAEVDFLFPAPFLRRELLIYQLVKLFLGSVFAALIFSVSVLLYLNSWLAAFVGIFLTLVLTQLISLLVALAKQIVAEHAFSATRKKIVLGATALAAAGLAQMLWQTPVQGIPDLAWNFRKTWTGRAMLAPFEVFSHAILAREIYPDLLGWAAGAAAIDLVLLVLVLKLDADFLEGAAAISQNRYEKMQRARRGGGLALPTSRNAARLRIPTLPWLGGVGPLAWRQFLLAIRTSRLLILMSLGIGGVLLATALYLPRDSHTLEFVLPAVGIGFITYMTFLFAMQLPWAFRGDIEHVDSLKSLPVVPLAVATGEIAGGVFVLAVIQFIVLGALLAASGKPAVVLTAAAFVVPVDIMMLGLSNILFLIYPVRLIPSGAPDFQLMGRNMLGMLLQGLILIPAFGIPAGIGGLVFWLSGFSLFAFAATSWLLLALELPLVLYALASLFDRYDPSTETLA